MLAVAVACLCATVFLRFPPVFDIAGDAPGYLETMRVMDGSLEPTESFIPNRILTTFPSTGTIALFSALSGDYLGSWLIVNTLYFFGLTFMSFLLFRRVTGSATGSALGALFVAGNYDVLTFGLNYLMDITGWFWFMLSVLFLFMHMDRDEAARRSGSQRYLWLAVLAAGVGGLFKEYAYVAVVPIGVYLLWEYGRMPVTFIKKALPLALVSVVPTAFVHVLVYLIYGYSYLDWYRVNTSTFGWDGWLWDFSRSIIIVLSVLLPVAVMGAAAFVREMRQSPDPRRVVFVVSLALTALTALAWPIITERLVFLVVPLAALFAAYAVKQDERAWPIFALLWVLYVTIALRTDGFILNYLYAL